MGLWDLSKSPEVLVLIIISDYTTCWITMWDLSGIFVLVFIISSVGLLPTIRAVLSPTPSAVLALKRTHRVG